MKTTSLLAILGVIIVLGCMGGQTDEVTTTLPKTTPTQPTQSTLKPDIQNFRDAVSGTDASACESIDEQRLKDICVRDIAVKEEDVELCEDIVTEDIKDLCYYKLAVNTKDSGLCENIGNDFIKTSCEGKA